MSDQDIIDMMLADKYIQFQITGTLKANSIGDNFGNAARPERYGVAIGNVESYYFTREEVQALTADTDLTLYTEPREGDGIYVIDTVEVLMFYDDISTGKLIPTPNHIRLLFGFGLLNDEFPENQYFPDGKWYSSMMVPLSFAWPIPEEVSLFSRQDNVDFWAENMVIVSLWESIHYKFPEYVPSETWMQNHFGDEPDYLAWKRIQFDNYITVFQVWRYEEARYNFLAARDPDLALRLMRMLNMPFVWLTD